MQPLSDRTAGFTDSVIRRMTRISNQYGAVNLSQGFPDFDPPKAILDRLAEVAHEDYHQYSITWGAQNFREALAAKQTRYMGRTIDPNSEIVVTCGSTEAMMTAMMTVTNPGDKVVIFSPFYENYGADTILTGFSKLSFVRQTRAEPLRADSNRRWVSVRVRSVISTSSRVGSKILSILASSSVFFSSPATSASVAASRDMGMAPYYNR